MSTSVRFASLAACLLALAPLASQATAINLNFETLQADTQVATAYSSVGVSIIGGSLQVKNSSAFPAITPLAGSTKFAITTTGFTLDVLNPSTTKFDIIQFAYLGGPFKVTVFDEANNQFSIPIDSFSGFDKWVTSPEYKLDKSSFGYIDRFVFDCANCTDGAGLDNIRLDLQNTTTPPSNPAPEPAGYALAALALLGAGLATRRRQR